jgi:hypothetical protein
MASPVGRVRCRPIVIHKVATRSRSVLVWHVPRPCDTHPCLPYTHTQSPSETIEAYRPSVIQHSPSEGP